MIYIFYNNFSTLVFKITQKYNIFISTSYLENILKLVSPKLIHSISFTLSKPSSQLMNVNHLVNDKIDNKLHSHSKFDKKYKNNLYSQDTLEIKKTKSKLNKKHRKNFNSLDIADEDIFADSENNFFDKKSIDLSIVKTQKINKNKKKEKNKIESISNTDINSNYIQKQSSADADLYNINKTVLINTPLTIQELANKLSIPPAEIITYLFLKKSISVTINQVIDVPIAKEIASSYDFKVLNLEINNMTGAKVINQISDDSHKVRRAPIITILGHVDHGKTTLLDAILKTNLVQKEHGGITQSISAYEVEWSNKSILHKLIFLDTPGHEAFKAMRIRGVQVTDIALLVVAADDGLQPQTIEAIHYIKEMNLSYIVVINKIDKNDVDIVNIKKNLAIYDIVSADWGGTTVIVEVSALTGKNIDVLLSAICHLSDTNNFITDPYESGSGTILESYLDKKQGSVANVVIQNGILNLGDIIVAANTYGKIKSIINPQGFKLNNSSLSSIVSIVGFDTVPQAGTFFKVVSSDKEAKEYCLNYSDDNSFNKVLKSLYTRVSSTSKINPKQLKLIIKTDTQGSLEAIFNLLSKISQVKVQINIISAHFGIISTTDVDLALATNSTIISFNINNKSNINNTINKSNVKFKSFNVIYDLFDYVKNAMLELIDPEYEKSFIGRAIVRTVFAVNRGCVAGCIVQEGKLKKSCYIHVYSNDQIVYQGVLNSLKRIKEDVEEVFVNNECGLMCSYNSWQESDIINAYELIAKTKTL